MSRYKSMAELGGLLDVGDRVGRLRVLEVIKPCHYTRARVKCDCGEERTVLMKDLARGDYKSCGCLKKERMMKMNKKKVKAWAP